MLLDLTSVWGAFFEAFGGFDVGVGALFGAFGGFNVGAGSTFSQHMRKKIVVLNMLRLAFEKC